jgi:hypothetical protein
MARPPRDLAYEAARRRHPHCHDIRLHYSDEVPWDNEALAKKNRELEALAQGAPLPPTTDELRPGSVTEPPHRCDFPDCPGHKDKGVYCYLPPCGMVDCPADCAIHTRFGRPPWDPTLDKDFHVCCMPNCPCFGKVLRYCNTSSCPGHHADFPSSSCLTAPHRCDLASCPGHSSKSANCIRYPDGSPYPDDFVRPQITAGLMTSSHTAIIHCFSCWCFITLWDLPKNTVIHGVIRESCGHLLPPYLGSDLETAIACPRCYTGHLVYYAVSPARKRDEDAEEKMAEEGVPAPPKLPDR